jgi:hypothetical protein
MKLEMRSYKKLAEQKTVLQRLADLELANEAQWNKLAEFAKTISDVNTANLHVQDDARVLLQQTIKHQFESQQINRDAVEALNQARNVLNDSFGALFSQHIKAWWNDMVSYRTPQLFNVIHNRIARFVEGHHIAGVESDGRTVTFTEGQIRRNEKVTID